MLKDGKVYGSIMPPDVHSLRIKEITLGDRIELQILALTDHPVGRGGDQEEDGQMRTDEKGIHNLSVGINTSSCTENVHVYDILYLSCNRQYPSYHLLCFTWFAGQIEVYLGDRYAACTPGPKLIVHYTGLVEPPGKVWCEHITGHSAMIVWSKGQSDVWVTVLLLSVLLQLRRIVIKCLLIGTDW